MKATVSLLRYWKTENTIETCEDAGGYDTAKGVFTIADGVGSSSFAGIWADALVQASLTYPLKSADRYELDWWLALPRKAYRGAIPAVSTLPSYVQESARLGAFSTFLQARMSVLNAQTIRVDCIAFGDSCVFIESDDNCFSSYPMNLESAFDAAPQTLPANPAKFNPTKYQSIAWSAEMKVGDVLVLATDAVARWIISRVHGSMTHMRDAFGLALSQTPQTWPAFIDEQRKSHCMGNDDSTALIIRLHNDDGEGEPICTMTAWPAVLETERQSMLAPAIADHAWLDVASVWGDGSTFDDQSDKTALMKEVKYARDVADAFHAMRQMLNDLLIGRQSIAAASSAWLQHAHLLIHEPCASKLVNSLRVEGVIV